MTGFNLAAVLEDIAKRNAGKPVLTVWPDGSYVVQGERDAEIGSRCEPALLNLDIATMQPIIFRTRDDLQNSIALHEKFTVSTPHRAGGGLK